MTPTPTPYMATTLAAMTDVLGIGTSIIDFILGNPVLIFFLAASIIPIGIGLFRRLSR